MSQKRRKSERQLAIARADKYASLYVRLSNADINGYVHCYTCGKLMYRKDAQCGHKESRQWITTRYDLDNMRPQCWGCNSKLYGNGKPIQFEIHLLADIGQDRVNAVHNKVLLEASDPVKYTLSTPEIIEIADKFREMIKKYKNLL